MRQTFSEIKPLLEKIKGTTMVHECEAIFHLVNALPIRATIIETGTGNGITTAAIAFACCDTDRHIITIDNYRETERYGKEMGSEWCVDSARASLASLGLLSIVTFVNSEAVEYLSLYPGKVDMVYLDDTHTYPFVKLEIASALAILRPNGIIAGHDYWDGCSDGEEVMRSVNESVGKPNVSERVWWKRVS